MIVDTLTFEVSLSFDFKNIKSLNEGINRLSYDEKVDDLPKDVVYFSKAGKDLIRNDTVFEIAQDMNEYGMYDIAPEERAIFDAIHYRTTFEFENEIASVSNKDYELSEDGKSVSWTKYLSKEEDKDKKIGVTIKTKK